MNEYTDIASLIINGTLKIGSKVYFMYPDNGHDVDIKRCANFLELGKEYTLERYDVGGFHTNIWIKGLPNRAFNSVNFGIKEEKMNQSKIDRMVDKVTRNLIRKTQKTNPEATIELGIYALCEEIKSNYEVIQKIHNIIERTIGESELYDVVADDFGEQVYEDYKEGRKPIR